jgi:Icc-related predicted phosphoesterase
VSNTLSIAASFPIHWTWRPLTPTRTMFISLLSDTHLLHREVDIAPCDLLIHAGDICFMGRGERELEEFNEWLSEQPASHRVVVPGNHDTPICADPDRWRTRFSNATLLINEGVTVEGLRIWGSPVTSLADVPFGIPDEAERGRLYSSIPEKIDILVTHGPPAGVLDAGEGCAALRRTVVHLKPPLHVFGHIHPGYGTRPTSHTLFANASILDQDGAPSHSPIRLRLDREVSG